MKKILAIGIIVLLVCGVVLVMAQNRSKNEVACTSLGATGKKNYTYDEDEITKLRQEIETQMREYTWADEIAYDLITGKYDRPPGARAEEFLPLNEDILALLPDPPDPVPALPVQPRTSQTTSSSSVSSGIAAGYQVFGGDDKPAYCGTVWCRTNSIPNLKDKAKEWHVIHQWGRKNGGGTENCIVITRSGDLAFFGSYVSSLGGYQNYTKFPANHTFFIGIHPKHNSDSREYNEIFFWVWDLTTDEFRSKTYTLPETELIYAVDAALEHDTSVSPNSLWKSFYKFSAFDKDLERVDLKANFEWLEWTSPEMNNEHVEDYYDTYGPNTEATLWQRKTPK